MGFAIAPDRGEDRLAALGRREPVAPGGDQHADGQPLDVPLPRTGKGLIEVVGVEDQRALGRGEEAEVGEVGVAAGLDDDAAPGRRRRGPRP